MLNRLYRISLLLLLLLTVNSVYAEKQKNLRRVALFIPWNDLANAMDEIEKLPTEKINAVIINFRPPLKNMELIKEAVERFHKRKILVIGFVTMEIYAEEQFEEINKKRGEKVPANFELKAGRNADGSIVLKGHGMKVCSFWDKTFKEYQERRIKFLKECGVDYIICGEWGYMMSPVRDFNEDALKEFAKDTKTELPTFKPGPELADFFLKNKDIGIKWAYWKYKKAYEWLYTLPVDGVGRCEVRGVITPVFEKGILNSSGGIGLNTRDFSDAQERIEKFKVPGKINKGGIQFARGNTGEAVYNPEIITEGILFLAQRLDWIELYASCYWKKYKEYIKYVPRLDEYDRLLKTADFNKKRIFKKPLPSKISESKGENLIKNAGFDIPSSDDNPMGWEITRENSQYIKLQKKANFAKSLPACIKITGISNRTVGCNSLPVPVVGGESYLLSFFFKTNHLKTNIRGNEAPLIGLDWRGEDGKRLKLETIFIGFRPEEWANEWKIVKSPEKASAVKLSLRMKRCSGTIWFDDIYMGLIKED